MAAPIFRWPGGKRRLVSTIVPMLERALEARPGAMYIEPFLGAGAVALAMPGRRMVLADACPDLMNAWQWIRRSPVTLHSLTLEKIWMSSARDQYEKERSLVKYGSHTMGDAARFLYLNAFAFNGVWRVNGSGEYNVPYGDGRQYLASLEAFKAAASAFENATLHHALANDVIQREVGRVASPVIYADPPYDGGFDGYTASGFGPSDQSQLAETLRQAARHGAAVVSSNADTPLIRELYHWAEITPIAESRTIAADSTRRQPAECLLITSNIEKEP
jgi:DNA adenine methylase